MQATVLDIYTNQAFAIDLENLGLKVLEPLQVCDLNSVEKWFDEPHVITGLTHFCNVFQAAKDRWIGVLIRVETPNTGTMAFQWGVVRHILPIIDEHAVTFRLLCEEDLGEHRHGRTGGWFIANPDYVQVVDGLPDDGPVNFLERIKCYDPAYRSTLADRSPE